MRPRLGEAPAPARTPVRGAVLATVCVLTPLFAYLGPLGFAALVAVAAGFVWPLWARRRAPWPFMALLATLVLWAAGTFAWSPAVRRLDFADAETFAPLKLVLELLCFGVFAAALSTVSGRSAERALRWLAIGLGALGAVLVLEGFSGAAFYQVLKRTFEDPIRPDLAVRNVSSGAYVLALLIWPAGLFIQNTRLKVVLAPTLAALALAPVLFGGFAPAAAAAAGGLAFLVVRFWGAWGARGLGVLLGAQVLLSPLVVGSLARGGVFEAAKRVAPASWDARLDIWAYAAARTLERPWTGWGLDASRFFGPAVPLHTHNAALQVWLELGAVGALLFALVWYVVFHEIGRAARRDQVGTAACAGAAGAYFTIGALSFGVWQEWWLALAALTFVVCAALLTARSRERMTEPPLHESGLRPL